MQRRSIHKSKLYKLHTPPRYCNGGTTSPATSREHTFRAAHLAAACVAQGGTAEYAATEENLRSINMKGSPTAAHCCNWMPCGVLAVNQPTKPNQPTWLGDRDPPPSTHTPHTSSPATRIPLSSTQQAERCVGRCPWACALLCQKAHAHAHTYACVNPCV